MPVENVFSRYIERQADEESLKLAGQPEAFIAAEKRLAIKNISRLDPHPLHGLSVLFASTRGGTN